MDAYNRLPDSLRASLEALSIIAATLGGVALMGAAFYAIALTLVANGLVLR